MIRKVLAIFICKVLRFLGKLLKRGSSLPGKFALLIDPDILKKIQLPEYVIAVTGSNGKTSTVEMIYEVLSKNNMSVAYNSEGSNQIDGVATLILNNCNLFGKFKKDVLLLESDERYAQYTFKYFSPTHYVITNLYRDQMTRNGHPEFVLQEIKKSIKKDSILLLNSDDPLISSLSKTFDNKVSYFAMAENKYSLNYCDSIYNDGYYCPICNNKMTYDYYHFAHIGKYHCDNCGFERANPDFEITSIDLDNGLICINGQDTIQLAFNSIYNAYNILAAYAIGKLLKVDSKTICEALNNYLIKNGRRKEFIINDKKGTLLISKHENSISYNRNLQYITDYKKDVTLLLVVDAISRKYFTSETSWLWDISFELLASDNIKEVVVSGKYAADIMTRLQYSNIDLTKISVHKNINDAVSYLGQFAKGHIFVLTCFSDEWKVMKEVKEL